MGLGAKGFLWTISNRGVLADIPGRRAVSRLSDPVWEGQVRLSNLAGAAVTIIATLIAIGCDRMESAPKLILADGQNYIACKDTVWVGSDSPIGGEATFKGSFTDAAGLYHVLRGIKKLEVSDIPKLVDAPMPMNPANTTSDGKPVVEGMIYTWENGSQARFHNGKWEAVQVPNRICEGNPGQ